jgi:hypothetical protein
MYEYLHEMIKVIYLALTVALRCTTLHSYDALWRVACLVA